MTTPRLRNAGDAAVVLELDAEIAAGVNAHAIGIAAAVRDAALSGVRDVVSTYRSVAVYFDPLVSDRREIVQVLEQAGRHPHPVRDGVLIEIPVTYGGESGPDLEAVAAMAGIPAEQVVARHVAVDYRVFMLGFMPGFAYLGSVDERIAVARRETPRTRVPAGSVGLAGLQTGVYPLESPGGWQLIGRTDRVMFDASRRQPALCSPGDRVRFVPEPAARLAPPAPSAAPSSTPERSIGKSAVTVLRPGLFTTVQDEGRWGHQASGVTVSGAMDLPAHRCANGLVGNLVSAPTLEVTLVGPELRIEREVTLAVSGADLSPTIDGRRLALDAPVSCAAGSVIRFGERKAGGRAYIAFGGGGITVPRVLGSAATHVRSRLGGCDGRSLHAGDRLAIGGDPADAPQPPDSGRRALHTGTVTLRAMKGPQDDWFPDEAFDRLEGETFTVHPQSDRMGYRLSPSQPLPRLPLGEMISDATFCGAVQVPPDGRPILLMADRQTTGGYPIIAVVISADIARAGQLLPGDTVRFHLCALDDARAALAGSEYGAQQ